MKTLVGTVLALVVLCSAIMTGSEQKTIRITLEPGPGRGVATYLDNQHPAQNFGDAPSLLINISPNQIAINTLLRFRISPPIPDTATIDRATLTLHVAGVDSTFPFPFEVGVYRILTANRSWERDTATWNSRDGVNPWAGFPGCTKADTDYDSLPLAVWSNPTLGFNDIPLDVNEVKLMIQSNEGMVLKTTIPGMNPRERFTTLIVDGGNSHHENRPTLTITFTR